MHSQLIYHNKCCFIFVFCAIFQIFGHVNTTEGPVITTALGKLRGSVMKSDHGKDFFAFRGIPYAKPPVGDLRFKMPQPIKPWNGILNATTDGNMCIQVEALVNVELLGVEDCLHLSVYLPRLPTSNKLQLLAVMVYIHGGTYKSGGSLSRLHGPQRLMDKDIILVIMNYRLGPFGFLSTEDQTVPGNMGLWDQNLAMKWVQDNIDAFGGDPNRVTLFGESAGSGCVGFHILSPHSKGLFSAAIYQSGTAVTLRSVVLNPRKYAQRLAENLECPTNSSDAIIQCLKTKQATDILHTGISLYQGTGQQKFFFAPVIDVGYGEPAFLPGAPRQLLASGRFNAVPIISGATKNEGMYYYTIHFKKSAEDMLQVSSVHRLASILFPDFMVDPVNGPIVTKEFIDEYFKEVNHDNMTEVAAKISDLVTESMITEWTDFTNEMTAAAGAPVYAYRLTYRGKYSLMRVLPKGNLQTAEVLKNLSIVCHADDIQYLYHWKTIFPETVLRGNDRLISDLLLSYWTNFAKTRKPFLDGPILKSEIPEWQAMSSDNYKYLQIDIPPKMIQSKICSAPSAWDEVLNKVKVNWPEKRSDGNSSFSKFLQVEFPPGLFALFKTIRSLFTFL